MIYYYKLWRGYRRLFWYGCCPKCNSDVPELYYCNICNHYKDLPRYKSEQSKHQINNVWTKYKEWLANCS